jgi:peroxiredoxin Q/BCP
MKLEHGDALTSRRVSLDKPVMISPGTKPVLDFSPRIVRAGKIETVAFKELMTRRLIVSVYMRNNTASCDRQNDALGSVAVELDRAGYSLVAISRDSPGSHLKYATKKGLAHTLVSDPADDFARAVDAIVEKNMYGRTFSGPARSAFLFDRDGTVLAVLDKVDPRNHAGQLRALVATLA